MFNIFNRISMRNRATSVLDKMGVEYALLPDGSLLIEGDDALRGALMPTTASGLGRALAENVWDSKDKLLLLNMFNYAHPQDLMKLIGSGPGFMGSDKGGMLTNHLMAQPDSVLFLDEIDKADQRVRNMLDEAIKTRKLKDANRNEVKLDQTLVVQFSACVSPETQQRRATTLQRPIKAMKPLSLQKTAVS